MRNSIHFSRRRFVQGASLAAGSAAMSTSGQLLAADATLRETADLITGPFYPQVKPRDVDTDLTMIRGHKQRAAGQVIQLSGRVMNLRGEPLRSTAIEVWQANTHGRYTHPSDPNKQYPLDPHFEGYARLRTDREGRYSITSIKPGPYATARGDWRAPHIHFEIQGAVDRKVTQMFFPGEELNGQDRHLNGVRRQETVIANVLASSNGSSVLVATWDIVLAAG